MAVYKDGDTGKWRAVFRFTDWKEEGKLLDDCVKLSGLTKQDFIIRKLLNREVVVQGNPRVYKALRNQMAAIYDLPVKSSFFS